MEVNGQRTLVRAIAAMADVVDGTIALDKKELTDAPLAARRAAGLRIIPFERNVEGLSLTSSLWKNWAARDILIENGRISAIGNDLTALSDAVVIDGKDRLVMPGLSMRMPIQARHSSVADMKACRSKSGCSMPIRC